MIDLTNKQDELTFKIGDDYFGVTINDDLLEMIAAEGAKIQKSKETDLKSQRKALKSVIDKVLGSGAFDKLYLANGNNTIACINSAATLFNEIKKTTQRELTSMADDDYKAFLEASK